MREGGFIRGATAADLASGNVAAVVIWKGV
jgi:hypothetical protein